jgi:hypothetical protein
MSPAYASPPCTNLNHRRSDAPVRHCPQCGATVNASHSASVCTEDRHAAARRQQSTYCVHCGVRLIATHAPLRPTLGGRRPNEDDPWR